MSFQYVEDTLRTHTQGTSLSTTLTTDGSTITLSTNGVLNIWPSSSKRRVRSASITGDETFPTLLSSNLTFNESESLLFITYTTLTSPHQVEVSLWDVQTLQCRARTRCDSVPHLVTLSPSNDQVYAAATSALGHGNTSMITLHDARQSTFGQETHSIQLPYCATTLAFSRTGSLLAIGTQSSRVELYRVDNNGLLYLGSYTWTQRPYTPIVALAFDADHLYVGVANGTVVVYDIACLTVPPPSGAFQPILTWTPHSSRPAHVLRPTTLKASADGSTQRVLLTASNYDTTVHLWDFTARVGSKPARLASVDAASVVNGLQPRGVRDVAWRVVAAPTSTTTTTTSRGAFVVVTASGNVKWFRAAGEVGAEGDDADGDGEDDSSHAQAPPIAGDV